MGKPVMHFEIGCRDTVRTRDFYKQLFGWQFQDYGPAAMMIDTQGGGGINGHLTSLGHAPYNYVTVYVQVEDLQAALESVQALGGKTLVPPVEVPGQGSFAWFADPDGNTIGLRKPVMPA